MTIPDSDLRLLPFSTECASFASGLVADARELTRQFLGPDDGLPAPLISSDFDNAMHLMWFQIEGSYVFTLRITVTTSGVKYLVSKSTVPQHSSGPPWVNSGLPDAFANEGYMAAEEERAQILQRQLDLELMCYGGGGSVSDHASVVALHHWLLDRGP